MRETDMRTFLRNNAVTLMFVLLCVVFTAYSGMSPAYVAFELMSRISRNGFIVLALIIPIVAGMGINFAISIGAMAAQIGLLWVLEWRITGIAGLAAAAAITVPLATLFGFLAGKLLNKMKGQEMIGSMILGFFANGVYQLLFLFVFGNIIPLNTPGLVIKGSSGVANTMNLSGPAQLLYALDGLLRIRFTLPGTAAAAGASSQNLLLLPLLPTVYVLAAAFAGLAAFIYVKKRASVKRAAVLAGAAVLMAVAIQFPQVQAVFSMLSVPVATFAVIAGL
ncbi:MAG TPA: ABC transporter permease, partial [Candidatus Limnocylindria bacterium]|nr:ABC transporter permease [Candidatus Limnocylindria bacterium]